MKPIFLTLILILWPFSISFAETNNGQPMERDLIGHFLEVSAQLAQLRQELPEMQQFADGKAVNTTDEIVAYLQSSPAYPDIKSILASSNFSNLNEFFSFSERLMAIRLYLQIENSNQATVFQTVEILRANLNSMRANNASEEIIQKAELVLQQQQQKAALIKASLEKLTEQDKNFANQNQSWLIELFSR